MFVQILGKSYDTDIENLNISYNQLTTLPETIGNFVNLKELNLGCNQLTILPESIGNLVNLKELNLSYNQLTILPESIGRLVNLRYLNLHNNLLTILPASILNIKYSLVINVSAYEINNLQANTEFLIVSWLDKELTNLPTGLKEIWTRCEKKELNHKLPFGCVIKKL